MLKKLLKVGTVAALATGCTIQTTKSESVDKMQQTVIHEVRVIFGKEAIPSTKPTSQEKKEVSKEIIEKTIILGENGKIHSLNVSGLFNDVIVKNAPTAKVVIKGNKKLVEDIQARSSIDAQLSNSYTGYSIMNGTIYLQESGDNFVGIVNGQISGTPYKEEEIPSLEVYIPENTNLDVDAGISITSIGKVGNLSLSITGAGRAEVISSHETTLKLTGAGQATIGEITASKCELDLSGSAGVLIQKGSINTLSVDTSGSSHIEILASVHDLSVDISGASVVKVPYVTGTISEDISGAGQLITQ